MEGIKGVFNKVVRYWKEVNDLMFYVQASEPWETYEDFKKRIGGNK